MSRPGVLSSVIRVIFLAISLCSAAAARTDFGLPSRRPGLPENASFLSPESYVPAEGFRYRNARVLWVNEAEWRKLGVRVPPVGHALRPEFESQLLDLFAYGTPADGDDIDRYFDRESAFTAFADRYGGAGMATNFGSGRARSSGRFQTKGGGRTALVGYGLKTHGDGKLSHDELFRDILWGENYGRNLPYGANPVLLGIDTGIPGRVLEIRPDPLRPAHIIPSWTGLGKLRLSDSKRVAAAVENIVRALPLPESVANPGLLSLEQRIDLGVEEYVHRLALQYGTAIGRRMFHGATSHSNFEISGRFIDFATSTTLPGYARAKVLSHIDAFGELGQIEMYLIRDFVETLNRLSPAKPGLDVNGLVEKFRTEFRTTIRSEMIALSGLPSPWLKTLVGSPRVQEIADLVWKVGATPLSGGNGRVVDVNRRMPERTGKYDLEKIMPALWLPETERHEVLAREIDDRALLRKIEGAFADLRELAAREAIRSGISEAALVRFGKNECARRNLTRTALYRSEQDFAYREFEEASKSGDSAAAFRDLVESRLAALAGADSEHGPFETVIREDVGDTAYTVKQTVFDALSGEERMNLISGRSPERKIGLLGKPTAEWCKSLFRRAVDLLTGKRL